MPCCPAFLPVLNDVQAVGDNGSIVESSLLCTPEETIFARLGSFPSFISGPIRSSVAPSNPITSTFFSDEIAKIFLSHILLLQRFSKEILGTVSQYRSQHTSGDFNRVVI